MVPAILVVLVTTISAFILSLNIVNEKEVGAIEQIYVTPHKKHVYVLEKAYTVLDKGMGVFSIRFFMISWGCMT